MAHTVDINPMSGESEEAAYPRDKQQREWGIMNRMNWTSEGLEGVGRDWNIIGFRRTQSTPVAIFDHFSIFMVVCRLMTDDVDLMLRWLAIQT